MTMERAVSLLLVLALLATCALAKSKKEKDEWGVEDDTEDEFWKDPPPSMDGPVINNQHLFKEHKRQLDVKLRPDPERTESDARELAKEWESELEDLKSEDTVAPNNKDSIMIKSRGDFEKLKEWIFSQPDAYEIVDITNVGMGQPVERFRRPGDTKTWSEFKREVYKEGPAPPKPAQPPKTLDDVLGLKKKLRRKGKNKGRPQPAHAEL